MVYNPVPGQLGPLPTSVVAPPDEETPEERVQRIRQEETTAALERSDIQVADTGGLEARSFLESLGADLESPAVVAYIEAMEPRLNDPNDSTAQQELQTFGPMVAQANPSQPATAYELALQQAQFTPGPTGNLGSVPGTARYEAMTGQQVTQFETHPETGWTRFNNGTLVNNETGEVIFDPTKNTPGSLPWFRNVVVGWNEDKTLEWKQRLHEFGYLSKDQAKGGTQDEAFRSALQAYHTNRYLHGGKPVVGDASLAPGGGDGADKPPLFNLEDASAQIRNDVREQYRRVYGVDPSDGEVQAWTEYIIRHGMDLQRKYRKKYDDPQSTLAATEAEEMFIERIENSPEAEYAREADEENTRLRDTFERMAVVTNSLTS